MSRTSNFFDSMTATFAAGLPMVVFASVWHRLSSGQADGDGPWLVGVTAFGLAAGLLLLAILPMDDRSARRSRAVRAMGSAVLGAVGLFFATWIVLEDDVGMASLAAFAGLAAILIALARWKPYLETLPWLLFPCLLILFTSSFLVNIAPADATRPPTAEGVQWSFAGLALVMVGGGVLAAWKAEGPGRWATFSLVSAAFLGWTFTLLQALNLVPGSATDHVYIGLALAAVYALAAYLCRPHEPRSEAPPPENGSGEDLSFAQGFARWSSPLAATKLFALGATLLTTLVVIWTLEILPALLILNLLAVALAAWGPLARIVPELAPWPIAVYLLAGPGHENLGPLAQWLAPGITLVGMLAVMALLKARASSGRTAHREVESVGFVFILAVGFMVWDLWPFVPSASVGSLWQEVAPGLGVAFLGVALLSLTTLGISRVGRLEARLGAFAAGMALVWVLLRCLAAVVVTEGDAGSVPIVNEWLWILGAATVLSILAARLVSSSKTTEGEEAFEEPWRQPIQFAFLAVASLFGWLWISLEAGRLLGWFGGIAVGLALSGAVLVWLVRRWVLRRSRVTA